MHANQNYAVIAVQFRRGRFAPAFLLEASAFSTALSFQQLLVFRFRFRISNALARMVVPFRFAFAIVVLVGPPVVTVKPGCWVAG
jgi:hypothetical protein